MIGSGSFDKTIKIGNRQNKEIRTLYGHSCYIKSIEFGPPECKLIASSSEDGTIRIWEIENCSCIKIFGINKGLLLQNISIEGSEMSMKNGKLIKQRAFGKKTSKPKLFSDNSFIEIESKIQKEEEKLKINEENTEKVLIEKECSEGEAIRIVEIENEDNIEKYDKKRRCGPF